MKERTIKFLGSYTYQLDGKGRVSLPAAFRRVAPDQRFVLVQVHPPALSLFPEPAWTRVEDRLDELLKHQPNSRPYVLSVMAKAVEVEPDSQGRILIPSRLQQAAELDGQALLVGILDKIEIWNPDRFEGVVEKEAEAFEHFAPQIFR